MSVKWLYEKLTIKADLVADDTYIKKVLNRYGALGWELVSCFKSRPAADDLHVIFKKPNQVIGKEPEIKKPKKEEKPNDGKPDKEPAAKTKPD